MSANAGIHIRPNHFPVSYGDQRKGNFQDNRLTLLSAPLAGLTVVGDANMLKDVHLNWRPYMPTHAPIIGRITTVEDWLKSVWGQGDAEKVAIEWAQRMDNALKDQPYDNETRYIYWQHKDETTGDFEWQVKFEICALREMLKYGRRYAGINLFTHNPPTLEWDGIDGWGILLPAVQAIAVAGEEALVALHVYVDSDQPLDFAHQQYGALRLTLFLERLRALGVRARFAITETGAKKPWAQAGLANYDALNDMLRWMYNHYQPYPEVVCLNLYDLSNIDDGLEDFYVPPETVRMIADYNRAHSKDIIEVPPSPPPKPEPPPMPAPPVEMQRALTRWNSYIRSSPDSAFAHSWNVVTTLAKGAKIGYKGPLVNGFYRAFIGDIWVGYIHETNLP